MSESEYIALVDPFKTKLFRFAKRFLVSIEEAEDATQDVLLKLWKMRDRLGQYKSLEAFAMTITKNHCLDRLKSKQAQNLKITHNNHKDHRYELQKDIEVSDSIRLIEKFITGLHDGSFPTNVISVPCNVVMTGISIPIVFKISLASKAEDA